MNSFNLCTFKNTFIKTLFVFLVFFKASLSFAYPGTLATSPLVVSSFAKPNIMFLIDDSGSMFNIVPDVPYNSATDGQTCASANLLNNTYPEIDIRITTGGLAYFNYNGTDYDWGSTGSANSTGQTSHLARCFNPTSTYSARLYGDSLIGGIYQPGNYLNSVYTGSYLNWYFGNSSGWPANSQYKPGTNYRINIAKAATTNLVNSLSNVRIGLATYNGTAGGQILVGVNDISTNLSTFITQLNTLTAVGMTPLAGSLRDIGRYFVQGFNNTLTLHPGASNQTTASAYTVFDNTPPYASGVSQASPIQYFCQKNFAIIVTDGQPQGDQVMNSLLADYDGDCQNANPPCLAFEEKPNYTYQSLGSDYIDDVANALYDIDLRPDLTDPSGNPKKSNMSTSIIGFADPQVMNDPLIIETAARGGGIFVPAQNTAALQSGLAQAISNVLAQVGSLSQVAFNTGSLETNTAIFSSQFNTVRWTGDLLMSTVSITGQIGSTVWQASPLLDALAPANRTIITYNKDTNQAVPFETISQLAINQQSDLNLGGTSALGQARLNYIRGDRSSEGTSGTYSFRLRSDILGDIVDSSPVYVGTPASPWPSIAPFPSTVGSRYSDFQAAQANRLPVVYIGANDGMLHGFRADTSSSGGQELLAYIPYRLFSTAANSGLNYLTNPNYNHTFYVDQTPAIADAYIKTRSNSTVAWHTILVGSLGRGGPGLFALDITNPSLFSESSAASLFLWEFTDANNADLGYTLTDPTIALMNNGRWAAIFGNGYNNAGSGMAKLFIVYLDGGANGTWTLGVDYQVISTNVGSTSQLNGLSSPAVIDTDGNGTADRIYAGDLYGNMWVFNVSSSSALLWSSAYGTLLSPAPLFTAKTASGGVEPITIKPILGINPSVTTTTSNQPNILVVFGTGEYLTANDITDTTAQTMYAVWDAGTSSLTRNNLVAQTLSLDGSSYRTVSNNTVSYSKGSPGQYGWFMDLTAGERVIVSPKIRNQYVFFNTSIPNATPCSSGGTGWLMSVSLSNGGNPLKALFDTNGDGVVNISDKVNGYYVAGQQVSSVLSASSFRGDVQYTTLSSGTVSSRILDSSLAPKTGRMSWHEIRKN